MKNDKNKPTEKKPFIKTKERNNGGIEVEISKSPSKTLFGKILAITIAALTVLGLVVGLIYMLTQI